MKKLAINTSHPIQYNAPLFRLLHERRKIEIKVFYTWGQTESGFVYDPDFKKEFKWDIPLLDGYEKEFVENISKEPGAGHYKGIKNSDLIQRIDAYGPDGLMVLGWSFQSHLQVLRHYKLHASIFLAMPIETWLSNLSNGSKTVTVSLYQYWPQQTNESVFVKRGKYLLHFP